MSLATRCPACSTVFRVVRDQLRVSDGWVRCGQCQEVFNAVESLFELSAEPAAPPPAPAAPRTPKPSPSPSPPSGAPPAPFNPSSGPLAAGDVDLSDARGSGEPLSVEEDGTAAPSGPALAVPAAQQPPPAIPDEQPGPANDPAPQRPAGPAPDPRASASPMPEGDAADTVAVPFAQTAPADAVDPAGPADLADAPNAAAAEPAAQAEGAAQPVQDTLLPAVDEPEYTPAPSPTAPAVRAGFEPSDPQVSLLPEDPAFEAASEVAAPTASQPAAPPAGEEHGEQPLAEADATSAAAAPPPEDVFAGDAPHAAAPTGDAGPLAETAPAEPSDALAPAGRTDASGPGETVLQPTREWQRKSPRRPRETGLAAGSDLPTAGTPRKRRKPAFMRRAEREAQWQRPAVRAVLGATVAVLGLMLVAQSALHFRDLLAARWPASRPLLTRACATLGCQVGAPRALDRLRLESSKLTAGSAPGDPAAPPSQLRLAAELRNTAAHPVQAPALELSLTDPLGELVARRVFTPAELGLREGVLAAQATWGVDVRLDVGALSVAGFSVEVFYP